MTNHSSSQDLTRLCADDVMQRKLVAIDASASLEDAERMLTEAQISGAPVLDGAGKVLGVLSIRDLLRRRAEDGELPDDADASVFDAAVDEGEAVAFERPPAGACAADVMTADVVHVPPSMPLPLVAARMVETRVHRVLVIDRERLVGIVSSMDVLTAVARMADRPRA